MDDGARAGWLAQCLGNSAHSPLGEEDLRALLDESTVEQAEVGAAVMTRNEPSGQVFIVETGKVALTRPGADRTPMLQILHPGDIFGDLGVLLGQAAPADAVVLEHAQFLRIDGERLLWLVSTRPRIAIRWMVSIAGRLSAAQDRLEDLLAGPLDFQIASLLRHIRDDDNVVRVSQETIAQLLGTRRPSVARSLASLERQGLIKKHYREIQITDPVRLERMIG
jgi:CRP-like cAMP-binding protein